MSSEVMIRMSRRADALPAWTSVLAVVAHPDDESFGLGALLDAFTRVRAGVEVLCRTHGEASTLHGAPGDLASLRGAELAAAAEVLGVTRAMLKDHPDGDLEPAVKLFRLVRVCRPRDGGATCSSTLHGIGRVGSDAAQGFSSL